METITSLEGIKELKNNRVEGHPEINNSTITFDGNNNILYCEGNVKLVNAKFTFNGNNSIVYLSSAIRSNYSFNLEIYNDSTFFIGRDCSLAYPTNINIQENQNIIIGSEVTISTGVNIKTDYAYPIYKIDKKKRVNHAKSVFIGDHVWIGHLAYISSGARIGSGSIIENNAYIPHDAKIYSNSIAIGNPAKIERNNVFYVRNFSATFRAEDSLNTLDYKSDDYIYNLKDQETLDLDKIDKILKTLNVKDRLEFIQKLFVRNKRKNRFTIK